MPYPRKRGFRNRIYSNLKMFLDDIFVSRGFYTNIASGDTNGDGLYLSKLFPVQTDTYYPADGSTVHVWQGYNRNWVAESGFQAFNSGLTSPTIPSGIFANGAFLVARPFDGTSGLAVDYRNGRAIIESGLAFSTEVYVPHANKEVWIDTQSRDMISTQVSVIDNTRRVAVNNVPSGEIAQLPMILMEIRSQPEMKGLQLGGGVIYEPFVYLWVVSNNRYDKDEIIDVLEMRTGESILMVDFDDAPQQFTEYGSHASGYQTYANLKDNYPDRLAWIQAVSLIENEDVPENGYYTALLRMKLVINIPDTL